MGPIFPWDPIAINTGPKPLAKGDPLDWLAVLSVDLLEIIEPVCRFEIGPPPPEYADIPGAFGELSVNGVVSRHKRARHTTRM